MIEKFNKIMDDAQEAHSKRLKKGLDLFKGIPSHVNLNKFECLIFKLGDINSEHVPDEFPFTLKKETNFTVLTTKHEITNYLIEIESVDSYRLNYYDKNINLEFVINNIDGVESDKKMIMSKFLSDKFNNLGVSVERVYEIMRTRNENNLTMMEMQAIKIMKGALSMMDNIINKTKVMISCMGNGYSLKYKWPRGVVRYTKKGFISVGNVTLVTTRHKNCLVICDAYPMFFEVDWKKMDKEC